MPTNKDFKRLVRGRMQKTGEAYTTARAHLLKQKPANIVSPAPGVTLTLRTATRDKSMRITWPDRTSVEVSFTSKGAAKSQVALQHLKLPDQATATLKKEYWAERLRALEDVLLAE